MGEKWIGGRGTGARGVLRAAKAIQDEVNRIMRAPTPAQPKELARQAEADAAKLDGVGLAQLERTVKEQAELINGIGATLDLLEKGFDLLIKLGEAQKESITKQGARIDMLHDLIEKQQTGARRLAKRIDNADAALITFTNRVAEAYPLAGEPTIQEEGDESDTPQLNEGPWDWARREDARNEKARQEARNKLQEDGRE